MVLEIVYIPNRCSLFEKVFRDLRICVPRHPYPQYIYTFDPVWHRRFDMPTFSSVNSVRLGPKKQILRN